MSIATPVARLDLDNTRNTVSVFYGVTAHVHANATSNVRANCTLISEKVHGTIKHCFVEENKSLIG